MSKKRGFLNRLVPQDRHFFPMFENLSGIVLKAAGVLQEVLERDDPVKHKDLLKQIKEYETQCDKITQGIFDELDKSFITPFDRENMNQLTSSLDSVIDSINGVSQRIRYYRPVNIPSEFKNFGNFILSGCEYIDTAISELKNLKKPEKILKACRKMSEIESSADDVYHATISEIFKKEKDAIELIKQKEILETMERTTDRIENVSDILKTIVLKST
jgi:predicted phosphate transport protein (TIGR00153 family)